MSKFKAGDRVRHTHDHSTATILAVYDGYYWMQYDGDGDGDDDDEPYTEPVETIDGLYELIPESFLPNGKDCYCSVYPGGYVGLGIAYSTLVGAESANRAAKLGIIRIDGQTGELSWAKGGPVQLGGAS